MTETSAPGHGLHERFLRGLARSPGQTAIRVGSESLTYEELHERALQRAGELTAQAPRGPHAVAVLADKGLTAYVGILAALYAGAAVVPLNPRFPAERTRRMLTTAGVGTVVADPVGRAALAETELDLPVLGESASASAAALDAPAAVGPSDIAYILFTSGSTGRPKGVPLTHGGNRHYFDLLDRRYDFGPGDVFSQNVGINFDCAMFELFCAWGAGAAVDVLPAAAHRELAAFIAERRMTVWFSVPSHISFIRGIGGLRPGTMPTLRWSFFAGEALLCDDVADWQAAAPKSRIENLYGPTELTVTITGHRWSPEASRSRAVNGVVPIGPVHPGHDHLLIDGEGESAVEGELCVTGPQMTAGYLVPEDNEGRFLERHGRRWYRTGDRVRRLDDGELLYLGRLDAQVQIQGHRVELAEIDHAVRQCAGVHNAVTVTRQVAGGGLELVVYYTGDRVPPVTLRRELSAHLPEGMMPKAFRHVTEFPLNANRKVDRQRLAREAAGTPEGPP
ncbi:amino acid adenylation domain-containing protein [Streptomyces sp. MP131-18]|uniref:amino acid adenylation domain-containing protein n=1 Tax=Streptomyces sp. MP131-18 TaxID=1857892 RepID=UPI00097CABA3|nr:amino acid adenylation domain-containing protein [Streptomyces sp. MP131-18]ONK14897.1 Surfactin synthase subunit 2 [Streptomyces sp. MP131-18]